MYRLFGLNFICDFDFAQLFDITTISSQNCDICITKGKVPEELENPAYKNTFISYKQGCVLLKIKGCAKFLINNGSEIIIDAEENAKVGDLATYTFGTAFGTLLYQRGILALHGSAIRTPKGAVIFSGQKGAGKSTTASALALRGWEYISDDVCAVHLENSKPVLYPGLSKAKLLKDSYAKLTGTQPAEPPISPFLSKYGLSFKNSMDSAPLHSICEITIADTGNNPYYEKICGPSKLTCVLEQVYRPSIHEMVEKLSNRFQMYTQTADKTNCIRIFRPLSFDKFESYIQMIEDKLIGV